MAGLPHADQGRFSVPRLDSGRADRARPSSLPRSRQASRHARHSGMAELLFQISHVRCGAVSRARFVYPVDETKEYLALDDGRGFDHAFGTRILRLTLIY